MDIKDIKTLIKVVTDTDITEFEMETEEQRIVIKRGKDQEVIHMSAPNYAAPVAVAPQVVPTAAQAAAPVAEVSVNDKYDAITSPIVGTFYGAPSPESDDYVKVGDVVEVGQTLCIVEAMKLMNEIEAEFKCKIVEFVKDNAQTVEFGDTLFLVEKL